MGPFAFDVVEPLGLAGPLVDQIELVSIADANLILSLAAGRVAIAWINQRQNQRRFAHLEFLWKIIIKDSLFNPSKFKQEIDVFYS